MGIRVKPSWTSSFAIVHRRVIGSVIGSALALAPASIAHAQQALSQTAEYVPGEVIVKLRSKPKSLQAQAFVGKAVSEKAMDLKGSWSGLNMHHFSLKGSQSVEQSIADLQADPDVEYAEPNYILHRQSAGPEGEPVALADVQAAAAGDYTAYSQTAAPIQLQAAWNIVTPNLAPPIVAIIDTGLDLNHDVFVQTGAIYTNAAEANGIAGVDDDANGYIDDIHGWNFVANNNSPMDDDSHGTHVSGIVLGTTQNISAVPLQPAKIRIMPLKFLDNKGSGTTSDAVKAIYYAVNNGAKVLNNSWGGGGFSNSLLDAIAYAYTKKVVFVAAAGNASSNNDSAPTYPANYGVPNMMSIAATSDIDGFASFSNYGASTVHMGSPGVSIWSTFPNNMFGKASGTSMATPFVSGLAALMVREEPEMTGYQIKQLVFGGANAVASLAAKTTTKARLNVYNAVLSAKSSAISGEQPSYSAASERQPASASSSQPMGGCGLVSGLGAAAGGGGASGLGGGSSGGFGLSPDRMTPVQKNVAFFGLLIVLASPVLLSVALRQRGGKNQRRFTRYQIDSSVRVRFGDRELVEQVSTISLGGVQLNTDEWLEKGGIVKMSIRSPDGSGEVDVEGKVVWSEEQKRYGVAFANANESALTTINRWTSSLLKA